MMLTALPTPEDMAAWDQAALELGVPDGVLMDNAARAACAELVRTYGPVMGRRVVLVMGGGNNGGDAACLARHLLDAGAEVLVAHTRPLGRLRGMTGRYARLAVRCGVVFVSATRWLRAEGPWPWGVPDIVVDGLLGTGFRGALRPLEADLVVRMNQLGERAFVLALDIPSGLDGLYGRPCPQAVRATLTVTFAAAKPGLVLPEATPWVGRLVVADIGMPRVVREHLPASWQAIDSAVLAAIPELGVTGHKGTAGHVVVVGGSEGLTGAPYLAGLGALRTGAGLVTLAGPESVVREAKSGCADLMTRSLGAVWDRAAGQALRMWLEHDAPQGTRALVCGPGIGRTPEAREVVAAVLDWPDRPVTVFDADALHVLAVQPELCRLLRPSDILTPHPGEAARLLGWETAAVQADRFAALARLRELVAAVVVLKGAGTLVGQWGQAGGLCPLAAPNLAVGGSGDVLAGCIAALAARGMAARAAALAGVALHAAAGRDLALRFPHRGNSASDLAALLPCVQR